MSALNNNQGTGLIPFHLGYPPPLSGEIISYCSNELRLGDLGIFYYLEMPLLEENGNHVAKINHVNQIFNYIKAQYFKEKPNDTESVLFQLSLSLYGYKVSELLDDALHLDSIGGQYYFEKFKRYLYPVNIKSQTLDSLFLCKRVVEAFIRVVLPKNDDYNEAVLDGRFPRPERLSPFLEKFDNFRTMLLADSVDRQPEPDDDRLTLIVERICFPLLNHGYSPDFIFDILNNKIIHYTAEGISPLPNLQSRPQLQRIKTAEKLSGILLNKARFDSEGNALKKDIGDIEAISQMFNDRFEILLEPGELPVKQPNLHYDSDY